MSTRPSIPMGRHAPARRPRLIRLPCRPLVGLLLALLGLAAGPIGHPAAALADGTPVRVVLTYQNGLSTWGPVDASGVMELVRAEGEARLTARGLPAAPGLSYVVWLTRDDQPGVVFRLGVLHPQPDGTATLDELLPDPIPDRGWNLVLVTAESTPAPDRPGPRRTIVGRILPPTPFGPMPRELPNTGAGGTALPADMTAALVATAGTLITLEQRRR
jgi:hypothetical protein